MGQYHVIRYVKQIESSLPKQHPIGMTYQNRRGKNQTLLEGPADWISPYSEGKNWDRHNIIPRFVDDLRGTSLAAGLPAAPFVAWIDQKAQTRPGILPSPSTRDGIE